MIPKKIHYCWFGGKPLPKLVKKCIKSWKIFCPDYEIIQWDESNFDINSHLFLKSAYEARAWAFASDYTRLKVIYEYGGIYLDTDVELLKNLDFLLENQCYIGVQQSGHLCNTGLGFGAEKENTVVYDMLKEYQNLCFSEDKKKELACPYLNHRVIEMKGYSLSNKIVKLRGVTVYPECFFDPITPGVGTKELLCGDTVSIHHYSASWSEGKNRLKRKIIMSIGQKNINKVKNWIGKGQCLMY